MSAARKHGEKESHPIPLWSGILDHRERIGPAIWEFVWLLDKVTKEDENGIGWVLGRHPVKAEQIAIDLREHEDTALLNLTRLETSGYIIRVRTPRGYSIGIRNSKKFGIWKAGKTPKSQSGDPERTPDHKAKSESVFSRGESGKIQDHSKSDPVFSQERVGVYSGCKDQDSTETQQANLDATEEAAEESELRSPAATAPQVVEILSPVESQIQEAFNTIEMPPFGTHQEQNLFAKFWMTHGEKETFVWMEEFLVEGQQRLGKLTPTWYTVKRAIEEKLIHQKHHKEDWQERRNRRSSEALAEFAEVRRAAQSTPRELEPEPPPPPRRRVTAASMPCQAQNCDGWRISEQGCVPCIHREQAAAEANKNIG